VEETTAASSEMTQPIIIDLGNQKAGNIKDLKKGEGKLWEEVLSVVEEVKEMLGEEADGKVILPVVMIYRKKAKRPRMSRSLLPYMPRMR
jgi:hypothetical protein